MKTLLRFTCVVLAVCPLLSACSDTNRQTGAETAIPDGAVDYAAVDQKRLLAAQNDTANWMSYGRSWEEKRYSPGRKINADNISDLSLAWAVELDTNRGQEATPIVVDGVMYVSTAWSKVMALNAGTGDVLWTFDPKIDPAKVVHACCDIVNRGVALWQGKVFVGALDGRLIALDAATGKMVWETVTVDQSKPYTITMAPRVYKDKVLIGNSGAEFGVRGFLSAYSVDTGDLVWRFYTVPGNPADGPDGAASDEALEQLALPTWHGEWWTLGGGGTVWDSVVYDAEFDQVIIGVGNGAPWNHQYRSEGKGDNLFLSSILAVDADTGKYKWHYQANPGESWDFTNTQQITLADLEIEGIERKVLMQAPKNGFFYVIDRSNGKLISAEPYVFQTWAEKIDLATGRPVEMPNARYQEASFFNLPSGIGAHAWMPMSYNPETGLVYIPAMVFPLVYGHNENYEINYGRWNTGVQFLDPPPIPGLPEDLEGRRAALVAMRKGTLIAWDPVKQEARWTVDRDWPWNGGTLTTGGNLVFQGTVHGDFEAYTADKGEKLWSYQIHRGIVAGPATYEVNGEQYVAVLGGYGGSMGVASESPFGNQKIPNGILVAFKLGGKAALPEFEPTPLPAPNPSDESFAQEQIDKGFKLYMTYCAVCHNGPVNPDLRRSALLGLADPWKSVVIDGALSAGGMADFAEYMDANGAEAIRAYVNKSARDLLENKH